MPIGAGSSVAPLPCRAVERARQPRALSTVRLSSRLPFKEQRSHPGVEGLRRLLLLLVRPDRGVLPGGDRLANCVQPADGAPHGRSRDAAPCRIR